MLIVTLEKNNYASVASFATIISPPATNVLKFVLTCAKSLRFSAAPLRPYHSTTGIENRKKTTYAKMSIMDSRVIFYCVQKIKTMSSALRKIGEQ